jgi:hypothetical protein
MEKPNGRLSKNICCITRNSIGARSNDAHRSEWPTLLHKWANNHAHWKRSIHGGSVTTPTQENGFRRIFRIAVLCGKKTPACGAEAAHITEPLPTRNVCALLKDPDPAYSVPTSGQMESMIREMTAKDSKELTH